MLVFEFEDVDVDLLRRSKTRRMRRTRTLDSELVRLRQGCRRKILLLVGRGKLVLQAVRRSAKGGDTEVAVAGQCRDVLGTRKISCAPKVGVGVGRRIGVSCDELGGE